MTAPTAPTATDLAAHLQALASERSAAALHGLAGNETYMAELEVEIRDTNAAYVGAAVTEIASLRGQLSGLLHG